MAYENILYEVKGPLGLITLNRPEKHNAVSLATLDELHDALGRAEMDDNVRVIGLTGAGKKSFASGSDLNEVEHRDIRKALEPIVQGFAERMERGDKPTIAAINGYCMGGGLELALGCDIRIGTTNSQYATPEGKLGIIPGGGATQRLPRIVGKAWGMEMLLMGETIDANRAYQIGLITRLVEPEELMPTLEKMSEHIAGFAPLVPQFMKSMVNYGLEAGQHSGLALEKFAQAALCETADKKEGLRAFLEKRPPNWSGR
ncbi:MAG: enoyl-CoA hydratase [Oleiphilus sp.]|nr:MAG: enoyl-CoA hydratase [Oleiphilus sp.]